MEPGLAPVPASLKQKLHLNGGKLYAQVYSGSFLQLTLFIDPSLQRESGECLRMMEVLTLNALLHFKCKE